MKQCCNVPVPFNKVKQHERAIKIWMVSYTSIKSSSQVIELLTTPDSGNMTDDTTKSCCSYFKDFTNANILKSLSKDVFW